MLQRVTVCYSVLQRCAVVCDNWVVLAAGSSVMGVCVAACCSVLQHVAACCSMLQRVAVCCRGCSVLQCVAVCDNGVVLATGSSVMGLYVAACCSVLHCVAMCCSVLQCVAVCCSVLQCVALCCSELQCVARI